MPSVQLDRLSALIRRFRLASRVVAEPGSEDVPAANLFVVRQGSLVLSRGAEKTVYAAPMLVYFVRGLPTGASVAGGGVDTECIAVRVDAGGDTNPVAFAMPDVVAVDLDAVPTLAGITDVLFEEVAHPRCGRSAVIDRLCEVLMIRLLRHLIQTGATRVGMLAGLSHPGLARAIVAMHERPEQTWRLEELADIAGMSRTRFANTFRDIVGETPGEYLGNWRLALARTEMAKGIPVKSVARSVGFSSPAAFSRAFSRRFGHSPRQELARAF